MDRTQLLRAAILRILDANHSRWGLAAHAVSVLLPLQGFPDVAESETRTHLDWLLDRRWVTTANSPLNPDARHYRITADGRYQI